MFSLRRNAKQESSGLLASSLFDERTFYKSFKSDLRGAQHSVEIYSPFMTERRALELSVLFKELRKQCVIVTIYTRHPDHHDGFLRTQSWRAIEVLTSSGVDVIARKDMMHQKLAFIDEVILREGSLNILSQSKSKEVMRRIESPALVEQMARFTSR